VTNPGGGCGHYKDVGQPSASDADLVRAALLGAREAFAELVRRHQRTATMLAARVLGSGDLASDAVQEAAVTAMTGLGRLRSPDRFGPWFCGIALNVARRWLRQVRAESLAGHPGLPDDGAGPDELAELADLAGKVRAAIADLADGQRDAVLLFYLQGLSHREVAAELGVSVGAVKSRLHQARAALAPRLAPLIEIREEPTMTAASGAPDWVDVSVADVRREDGDGPARKHVLVLEAASGRQLPIWVGPVEAMALAMTLEAVETARPLTYQMAAGLLQASGARLTEARITRLTDGVFYALLLVDGPAGPGEVDARPSDAITLACVLNAPIRAEAGLLADDGGAADCHAWHSYPTRTAELAAETETMLRGAARLPSPAHDRAGNPPECR
jgi:RNA polymerase sigma factor (sigma-70 family)